MKKTKEEKAAEWAYIRSLLDNSAQTVYTPQGLSQI
jgi:hypothetical protein